MKCEKCGFENPEGFRYCGMCGNYLIQEKQEKARRRVIVMFADLSNFTSMARYMDPEELKEMVDNLLKKLSDVVFSYKGYIDKIIGDALMILFGAPISHEDEPERSIRCAYELLKTGENYGEEIGKEIKISIGIARGLSYAGEYVRRGEYTVIGKYVNLAERLQKAAPAGSIYVSREFYNITKDIVDYKEIKDINLKGFGKTSAFELVSFKSVKEKRKVFVGRNKELKKLKKIFDSSISNGGNLIFITGERGIGKSRLYKEFKKSTPSLYEKFIFSEVRSLEYTKGETFYTLRGVINKLRESYIHHRSIDFFEHKDFEFVLPYIKYITKSKISKEELGRIEAISEKERISNIVDIILSFILKLSSYRPLFISVEDAQYMDEPSLLFFKRISKIIKDYPILILMLTREIPSHFSSFEKIKLSPFTRRVTNVMLKFLSGGYTISRNVVDFVYKKTKGNPLFIEELMEEALDKKLVLKNRRLIKTDESMDVSDRIYDIVVSRVDTLEKETARVLKVSSVIGFSFEKSLLSLFFPDTDINSHIKQLMDKNFILPSMNNGETLYEFKNELIKEVAYDLLLKRERRIYHEKIAKWIEKTHRKNLLPYTDILAYHYFNAESSLAYDYLLNSGRNKLEYFRIDEALKDFEKASKFKEDFKLVFSISKAYLKKENFEKALDYYNRAFTMASTEKEKSAVILDKIAIHTKMGNLKEVENLFNSSKNILTEDDLCFFKKLKGDFYLRKGDYARSIEMYEDSLKCTKDKKNIYETYNNIGVVFFYTGDLKRSYEFFKKSLDIKMKLVGKDHPATASTLNNLAVISKNAGKLDEAMDYYKEALKTVKTIFGELHHKTGDIYANMGTVYFARGELNRAIKFIKKGISIIEKTLGRINPYTITHYQNLGIIYSLKEDFKKSLIYFNKALEGALNIWGETHIKTGHIYLHLASLYKDMNEIEKCAEYLNKSKNIFYKTYKSENIHTARLMSIEAEILFDKEDYKKASSLYKKSFEILKNQPEASVEETILPLLGTIKTLIILKDYRELKPYVEEAIKVENKVNNVKKREQLLMCIAQYMAKEDKEKAEEYIEKRKKLLESL